MVSKVQSYRRCIRDVAMSYITPEAMKMKIKFLQEFKRMKEHIQKVQQQPKSVEDAIIYSMTELKQIKSRQDVRKKK